MDFPEKHRIEATSIFIDGFAILIRGKPGSGKSTLALQLIERGARLISDDITDISVDSKNIIAYAPERGRGCLEVRSVGIVDGFPTCESAVVQGIVELVSELPERIPEQEFENVRGIKLPVFRLWEKHPALPEQVCVIVKILANQFRIKSSFLEKE